MIKITTKKGGCLHKQEIWKDTRRKLEDILTTFSPPTHTPKTTKRPMKYIPTPAPRPKNSASNFVRIHKKMCANCK